jgi:hypothetical protein
MLSSNTSRPRGFIRAITLAVAAGAACLALAAPAGAAENFVIGNGNSAVGSQVTFWGAQWWKLNSLSGGTAPASFKGFANEVHGSCGGSWTTDPGNSSEPPEGPLPPVIEAVVSSKITKKGKVISGNITEVVLIATNLGYRPNPGHAGTGTVIGVKCSPTLEEEERQKEKEQKEKEEEENIPV